MNRLDELLPPTGRLLALDALVLVWVLFWLALGLKVGNEVAGLKELSGTVRTTGSAVEAAGRTLESLGDLPVVGSQLAESAKQIEDAGRSVVRSGSAGRESIESLSLLLGLSVAVIPSVPAVGFYLPARLFRRRERRALRHLVDRADRDPAVRQFLAARALRTLPLHDLLRAEQEPWRASEEQLVQAELRRHGLR